ncbi:MAG TPA: MMPL family transporter [Gemmata sp.]|nr:MMPL family transporter [Gemmata sp.]
MSAEFRPDFLARSVMGLVAWIARYPWVVLVTSIVLTGAAVHVAYNKLAYHTQRNDLLSPDKPCQQRWQKYIDAFGDDDEMVVVVEGKNREQMIAAIDAVAEQVKQRPDLFDRVFYRVDLERIRNRAILHLPPDQLNAIRNRLDRMEPLLGSVAPMAWRMLSIQSLLTSGEVVLKARAAGRSPSAADQDLLAQLPFVMSSAANTLRDPAAYRDPWNVASADATSTMDAAPPGKKSGGLESAEALFKPQYFFIPDGSLALFTCRPKKTADSFTPAKEANAVLREILASVGPNFPDLALGLTGLPVLETDEMDLSNLDSTRASWMALLGVAVLYFVVYRGFRYPPLTIATLVIGTLWALGWATITVGHLNILSATFAVMLIGLGDYGVLWVAQYDKARQNGESVHEALMHTAAHAGPSILTAAATTGLAFFAVMLADFKAVAELGWIAGSGILLCAASCVLLMPAMLVIVEGKQARGLSYGHSANSGDAKSHADDSPPNIIPFPRAWVPGLARRPRLTLGVGAVMLIACVAFATRLSYDQNLLHLQVRGLDSVEWEHKLLDRAVGATWDTLSIAHSREEALALKAKYEATPEVSRVVEVASLVPEDQSTKLPIVQQIHDRLAGLPPTDTLPVTLGSDPVAVKELTTAIARLADKDSSLAQAAVGLIVAIEHSPAAAMRFREFDRHLVADLSSELHQLKAVSQPKPITLDDVPTELHERYIGAHGEYLVRAFARDSLWEYDSLQRFTIAATDADPEATGKAFRTLEGLRQMKLGFEKAALYALAAILIVLIFDLRRLQEIVLGLFPLAIGGLFTLGVMGLCGIPLNPANMIALPLIVGVGVDNGVHVMHDFLARPRGVAYRLGSATGRGVFIARLTTVIGFGTLIPARHEGMSSLGLVLTLGVMSCMMASLVFLPAFLRVRDLWRLSRPRKTLRAAVVLPMLSTQAKAA